VRCWCFETKRFLTTQRPSFLIPSCLISRALKLRGPVNNARCSLLWLLQVRWMVPALAGGSGCKAPV